jgi:mono/diheme cytochrome c family protein
MRTAKKILKWTSIGVGGLVAALVVAVMVLERRTYDPGYPALRASADPAVIARGRYLVHGPAHCVDCHSAPGAVAGGERALSGGVEFRLPIGTIRSANLTADRDTGIGAMRDEEIARSLRYGVRRDGRALAPFMPFGDLSDADLAAIISYLRTQRPVKNQVETRALNPLGHLVAAFVLKPKGPTAPIAAQVPAQATADYGRYLAHNVANCVGCHTQRDMRTGQFTGPTLAGGLAMKSETLAGVAFVTPNLTPAARTGRIAGWTEEVFVARFQMGKGAEGSPMPWASFGRMSDDDLRALFRYLKSVRPVESDTGDSVRAPVAVAAR